MALVVKMEALPGDSIKNTANEMCAVAARLGICVDVDFNGVTIFVKPGASPETIPERYRQQLQRDDGSIKMVVAGPE